MAKGKTKVVERTHFCCNSCDRYFNSQEALEAHWLHSNQHAWCQRCHRFFKYDDALESHLQDSQSHWLCDEHDLDFETWAELKAHYQDDEGHMYCQICDEHFSTTSDFRGHAQSHLPNDINCWGCERTFNKYSRMLAHLETEKCSVTRVKLDKLAVTGPDYQNYVIAEQEEYLRKGGRKKYNAKANFKCNTCNRCHRYFPDTAGLLSHVDSSYHHPCAYRCPGCSAEFADISGLLTHVETSPCSEGISYGTGSIGKLLQHLWRNVVEG